MKLVHSPWPLFSDDLDFAQRWMRDQLSRFPMSCAAGHNALNIGLREEVERHLAGQRKDDRDDHSRDYQFRFRLARLDGASNPYQELIDSSYHGKIYRLVAEAAQSKTPLAVQLFGGLGDQLEMLSLVLPWGSRHGVPLRLIAEEQRCELLEPLLPEHANIEPFDPETFSPFSQVMAIRMGLLEHDPTSRFRAWIKAETHTRHSNQMVCCWRAEGQGNSFSAHNRSVHFPLVYRFYQRLLQREPQTIIFDITAWRSWEMRLLQQLGVSLQDPVNLGLTGLVNLCRGRRIISIDTALVHLCAAMGHAAESLLPRFPDERWFELSKPQHNYGEHIRFHNSTQFGCWDGVMASLY